MGSNHIIIAYTYAKIINRELLKDVNDNIMDKCITKTNILSNIVG
jgi:hypothetical protein